MTIAGRTVLVTGAGRGIGRALVEEALARGAARVYAGTRHPLEHPDARVTPLIAHVSGRVRTVPLLVGSYLAVWALVGVAVYGLYRPHGSLAVGAVVIAAGACELTLPERRFRRACRDGAGSGLAFGVCCVGFEHRADGDAGGAGRHEHHLDGDDHRPRPRPEATARQRRHRCAAGAGDHRTWNPDRYGTVDGAWTHATDVRGRR